MPKERRVATKKSTSKYRRRVTSESVSMPMPPRRLFNNGARTQAHDWSWTPTTNEFGSPEDLRYFGRMLQRYYTMPSCPAACWCAPNDLKENILGYAANVISNHIRFNIGNENNSRGSGALQDVGDNTMRNAGPPQHYASPLSRPTPSVTNITWCRQRTPMSFPGGEVESNYVPNTRSTTDDVKFTSKSYGVLELVNNIKLILSCHIT